MSPPDEINVRNQEAQDAVDRNATYEWGFSSDIAQEFAPKGLSEETVRFISAKKNEPEWMLEWRLKAYRAWLKMEEVTWAKLDIMSSVVEVSATANEFAAPAIAKLVWALDHGYKATWRQILTAVRNNVGDSTFGVSGVRDNKFKP